MTVRKPALGTALETDGDLVVVIDRRWEPDQIADVIEEHAYKFDLPADYHFDVATWHYHTDEQKRTDGWCVECDTFWSPAGWGKTSIDVARVPRSAHRQ